MTQEELHSLFPPPDKSLFRNSQNTRYYKGMFWELAEDRNTVVYTLKDYPWEGYPSLYQVYLASGDPEEFTFANTYLDGFEQWEKLCETGWFRPYVKKFRSHLDKKIKSESLARIMFEGASGGKSAFSANRFLVEKGWATAGRGRPSKGEILQSAHEIATTDRRLQEDAARILTPSGIQIAKIHTQ